MSGRTLTSDDRAAASAFAKALLESGRTHEDVAADVGVTAGMVYQWAKPLRAISLKRAPAVAAAVGIADPSTISVAYAKWLAGDHALRAPTPTTAHPATPSAAAPLTLDERAILDLWRSLDTAGRKAVQTVGHALVKPPAKRAGATENQFTLAMVETAMRDADAALRSAGDEPSPRELAQTTLDLLRAKVRSSKRQKKGVST